MSKDEQRDQDTRVFKEQLKSYDRLTGAKDTPDSPSGGGCLVVPAVIAIGGVVAAVMGSRYGIPT
jgi:hypothetical protein